MAGKPRADKKAAFLAGIAATGTILGGARASRLNRNQHYEWMHADPEYPARYRKALDEAAEALENEARRRANAGSDVLLMFLLNGMKPEKYKRPTRLEHSGPGGEPLPAPRTQILISFADLMRDLDDVPPDQARVLELLAARGAPAQSPAPPVGAGGEAAQK